MDRLDQQLSFIREIDKLKNIFRRSLITDGTRYENDVEHSWHLAVMVTLLSDYAAEPVDLLRMVKMVLVHDIVEIDAGDTIVYDTNARKEVVQAEQAAADRLFGMLPEDQSSELRVLWDEFEARVTPEARFARALDRLQPIMLNCATDGRTWRENKVTYDRVVALNRPIIEAGAPVLLPFFDQLLLDARENGCFREDE